MNLYQRVFRIAFQLVTTDRIAPDQDTTGHQLVEQLFFREVPLSLSGRPAFASISQAVNQEGAAQKLLNQSRRQPHERHLSNGR